MDTRGPKRGRHVKLSFIAVTRCFVAKTLVLSDLVYPPMATWRLVQHDYV